MSNRVAPVGRQIEGDDAQLCGVRREHAAVFVFEFRVWLAERFRGPARRARKSRTRPVTQCGPTFDGFRTLCAAVTQKTTTVISSTRATLWY